MVYILAGRGYQLYGIFSTKEKLNEAIAVVRKHDTHTHLYWQEVEVDNFDTTIASFFTMHPEKLIEVERENEEISDTDNK